jgi:CheY-like chemotaxis protein/two-component sensor histidine kinase
MERFLATLAHELRGPLAPLLIATEQLREPQTSEVRVRQLACIASRQVKQLERLIDDLFDLNRVHHGHLSVRLAALDLGTVIEQAAEAVEPLVSAKGQRLTTLVAPGPFPMVGDAPRLIQVLFNLLTNASRYSDHGAAISIEATRADGYAVVAVSDAGIGISKENLENIFEVFKQVAPLSEKSKDGFGVGLALVQELVRLHHGRVEAVSEGLGQGSTFRVLLPLAKTSVLPAVAGQLGHVEAPWSAQQLVLPVTRAWVARSVVVDDDADSAESLGLALNAIGVEVRLAYDGLEGLSAVEEFAPQVVFLDLSLPQLSGIEVARRIRTAEWGKAVRIVALTGNSSARERQACVESGFNAHLTKPIGLSDLRQVFGIPVS